ncbi:uridine kinase family protein [Hoyosella subflava]|uniref:uridine kinase family protein n=1 Tax=Hoyosella subflava TaxID=639313 RepID=UPI001ED94FE2|nr:uridine kinase [Hoyosella subflava]
MRGDRGLDEDALTRAADVVSRRAPKLGAVRLGAIDGPSGSGKTVFSQALSNELNRRGMFVAVIPCDDFATWDRPAAWWPMLEAGVLNPIERGADGRYQAIRWAGGLPVPGPFVDVPPPDVLLIEGVSSARRSVAGRLSVAVWVEWGDAAARLEAAVARDGEACRAPLQDWQAFERGWFPVDGTRARCDVIAGESPGSIA